MPLDDFKFELNCETKWVISKKMFNNWVFCEIENCTVIGASVTVSEIVKEYKFQNVKLSHN